MVQRHGKMDRFAKKLNMRFALPGLIALAIMAFIHELLPRPIRFYAYGSVLVTLLVGLLSGQFRLLGLEQAEAVRKHDPEQTLNRRQMAVVYAGIVPTVVLATMSYQYADYAIYFKVAFLAVVGAGVILICLLRSKAAQVEEGESDGDAESSNGTQSGD